jgi:Flp pilus assembly protein TadG
MRSFFRNTEGGALVLGTLVFPVLLGFGAFAVDLSDLYYNKSKLQEAADSAALGAVLALPNASNVTTKALDLVGRNAPSTFGTVSTSQDITVGYWDSNAKTFTASSTNQNAVQVLTHRTVANGNPIPTYFGKFVGKSVLEVSASAIAVKFGGACMRVLNQTATNALYIGGSGSITTNCAIQVDSSSTNAAYSKGNSQVSSSLTCVNGGYKGNGWTPVPTTGCVRLGDPLAGIPEPAQPTATCTVPTSGGVMTPNCTYTGTVTLSGNLTMPSGLYYFKGATVTAGSNMTLTGTGVTIFLDSGSTLSISGNGSIDLSSATTGTYTGLLLFQSRSTPASHTLSLIGDGSLSLNGSLYVPSATLTMGGNSTYSGKVGYAIADTLNFTGSSSFTFNAFPTSGVGPRVLKVHAGLAK